jgi:hypothetical protein
VSRDLVAAGKATAVQMGEQFQRAGASLAATLAALRESEGWSAAEALAWLADQTDMAQALDLLEEEYGLSLEGLLDSIHEVYDESQGSFQRLLAFQMLLLHRQHEAQERIIRSMDDGDVPEQDIAEVLMAVLGSASSVADHMVSAGLWSVQRAVQWMADAGADADAATAWLLAQGLDAVATAVALGEIGVAVRDIITRIRDRVDWAVADVAAWLLSEGHSAAQTASILGDATDAYRTNIARALRDAGVPLSDIWPALVSGLQLGASQLVEVMGAMNVSVNEIAAHLMDLFAMSLADAMSLVTSILGGG